MVKKETAAETLARLKRENTVQKKVEKKEEKEVLDATNGISVGDKALSLNMTVKRDGNVETEIFHIGYPHKDVTEESNCPICRYLNGQIRMLQQKLFHIALNGNYLK